MAQPDSARTHDVDAVDADALAAALVARGLGPVRVQHREVVDSTNQRLLDEPLALGATVLVADAQQAGRGRRGRVWVSPAGASLYLSVACQTTRRPVELLALPLAIGVVAALRLRSHGADVGLKWPNDLLVGNRKLGGLLVENRSAGRGWRVVIGIGVNLSLQPAEAEAIDQPWTDLATLLGARRPTRAALAGELAADLLEGFARFEREGLAPFREGFAALDLLRDREVEVRGEGEAFRGRACGIDARGALLVRGEDGAECSFLGGELSVRA